MKLVLDDHLIKSGIIEIKKIKSDIVILARPSDPIRDGRERRFAIKIKETRYETSIDLEAELDKHLGRELIQYIIYFICKPENWSILSSETEEQQVMQTPIDTNIDYYEFVIKTIKKTVKYEDSLIRQIVLTGLSAKTDDPVNLGIVAPTSEGKTYAVIESMQYFPDEIVMYIGNMSTKVLVRQKGVLVDSITGDPIAKKVRELKVKIKTTSKNDEQKREELKESLEQIYENSKIIIDLTGKILVFFEPPHHELWNLLKPILSHDKKEMEFPLVDKNEWQGIHTKRIVVRGWPACIFCSARDESNWSIWPEIQSRFLISSPNMIPQKYHESNLLISQRRGLPNSIQERVILSSNEKEMAKSYISCILQNIKKLKQESPRGEISLWIPYSQILGEILASNKGTDVRIAKRIFSFLDILPIIKAHLRPRLVLGDEKSIIGALEDLHQVLSITQNFSGIPAYKMNFFKEIFCPCYASKTSPDENTDGTKKEEVIAVTNKQLCDFYKLKTKKSINSDILKKRYLNEFYYSGIIEQEQSIINNKQYVYYPIVEPLSASDSEEADKSISFISKSSNFDKDLHYSKIIMPKNCKEIPENWLILEILSLFLCRYAQDSSIPSEPLADLLNKEVQLFDKDGNRVSLKDFSTKYEYISRLNRYLSKSKYSNFHSKFFGDMKFLEDNFENNKES